MEKSDVSLVRKALKWAEEPNNASVEEASSLGTLSLKRKTLDHSPPTNKEKELLLLAFATEGVIWLSIDLDKEKIDERLPQLQRKKLSPQPQILGKVDPLSSRSSKSSSYKSGLTSIFLALVINSKKKKSIFINIYKEKNMLSWPVTVTNYLCPLVTTKGQEKIDNVSSTCLMNGTTQAIGKENMLIFLRFFSECVKRKNS
ncbi:hypothetical protein HAX54_003602 [Datura stramonium]|uniref:Uncharacterized protein n=1 Tax=Datura stramonium TaxID=4076 RepID=A0ABS8T5M0_DATST|nr:hypothetical protein [Datura stramonium]